MLKYEMTRQEIANFIKSCKKTDETKDGCPYSKDQLKAVNDFIDYIVDELGDPNLAYNTETGFFDYIGPIIPS